MNMAEEPSWEVVRFSGNDEESTHLIYDNHTTVFSSKGSHNKGSSNLTLKNFVDINWDQCYFRGQLIALHVTEELMAYGFTKPNTSEGLVRIIKKKTNERTLIKGFSGLIEDISFAHIYEIIMFACIDQSGSVYVSVVKEDMYPSRKLRVFQVFHIVGDPSFCYKNKNLLSWCKHIPEQVNCLKMLEFEPSYKGKMLAVVRGFEVEIWHIGNASCLTEGPVCADFGLNKLLDKTVFNNLKNTVIKINLKDSEIVSVSFSTDGSTISLALCNGTIYFYQISFGKIEEPPKTLYVWHPQELFLSLRSMVFLDNFQQVDGDVEHWKYVVTYTNQNEIILWSCETWKCIQKIVFVRPAYNNNPMKLSIDGTGKYLFLSDIDNNFLYVMETSVDIKSSSKNVRIVSVTEILLQSPMLNIIIINSKMNRNDLNCIEDQKSSDNISYSLNKYTSVINLLAIQPKSLQEGQLIISSPDLSTMEQLTKKNIIEPTKIFPEAPIFDNLMDNSLDFSKDTEKNNAVHELSSMEIHNLVKEKLRLKGVHLQHNNMPNTMQLENIKTVNYNLQQSALQTTNNYNKQQTVVQPSNNYNYTQNTCDLNEARECSPINSEVQKFFQKHSQQESKFTVHQNIETNNDNFESASSYSIDIEKDDTNCFSGDSVFNSSSISTIQKPRDKSEVFNNEVQNKIDDIYTCLQDIKSQLKCISKKQAASSSLPMSASDFCQNIEPTLMNMVQNLSEHSHRNLQILMEQQLTTSLKNITDFVKSSNLNKLDTDLFTKTLVASLSPTLDAILKELFMTTVIPKFEHACCSMFKQIDDSFTERSLEYQNELKLLLNEEGNINYKLECAFDKFKNDMSNIIKYSEKKILNAQNDMQNQFSSLLIENSLSHVESFVKTPDDIANQIMILADMLERGNVATAFEKALTASNLQLVLFVCEKIPPEKLFQQSNVLKTPIVLSLIQQLSYDLSISTELKHRYLDAAVGSLDYTNDLFKENICLVLTHMNTSVEKFLQNCPYHQYFRKFKMLQLAVKTIISYNRHTE